MNERQQIILEWLNKADNDYRSAQREILDEPNYDLVCFLSQQGIEKILKAFCILYQQPFGKTHDLEKLARIIEPFVTAWQPDYKQLDWLSEYGVMARYPGITITQEQASHALTVCGQIRNELLPLLDKFIR